MVSLDQRASRSPALTTMVPSMGVALTKVPFGERTWSPPRESWKSSVTEPVRMLVIGFSEKLEMVVLTVIAVFSCANLQLPVVPLKDTLGYTRVVQ